MQASNFVKAGLPIYHKVQTYHNISFVNSLETDKAGKIFFFICMTFQNIKVGRGCDIRWKTPTTLLKPQELQVLGTLHINNSIIIATYVLLHMEQKKHK